MSCKYLRSYRRVNNFIRLHNGIEALRQTTLAASRQQTVLGQIFPGGTAHPAPLLSFRQALHLAQHWGQIRTLRIWCRKTRGEPGRFFPDNPTFPA